MKEAAKGAALAEAAAEMEEARMDQAKEVVARAAAAMVVAVKAGWRVARMQSTP